MTSNGTFNTSTNTYSTTDPPKLGATSSSMVPFVYCFYNSLKTAPYWRCNASNPAGAIYSARSQFSGSAYVGSNNNIILITNQLPYDNTKALTTASWISSYGTGVTTTTTNGVTRGSGSSTTALCGAGSSPSQNCSNTLLKYMAQGQAIAAGTAVIGGRAGINLSTIYYSGDAAANIANTYAANTSTYATPDSQTGAATEIGSWIQNSGVAATTATLTALPDVAKGVCLASFPTVTAMPLNTTTH